MGIEADNNRTVIIGLDGVPHGLIQELSRMGAMPNVARIIQAGVMKRMNSSIPEVSSVAWSSIITGVNPAEHGIFGFTDLAPGTYDLVFPNFEELKSAPFWEKIPGKSVIINVPSTYPVRSMNGIHISGFVSIDINRSVYPRSLVPELKKLDYRLDVDSGLAHESLDLFLEDLDKTLKARVETIRYLWSKLDFQVFMPVFTGTDRLMHFLWDACEQKGHQYHGDFLDHFRKIDRAIGEIVSWMKQRDRLIILSDHGFEHLEKDVYINNLLIREGLLKVDSGSDDPWNTIDKSSEAFALDPARIYINRKGKYPRGRVNSQESEEVIRDLARLFESLEYEGQKVIRDVYRKEEIYSGPLLDRAPDLILVSNTGFNLKGSMKADKVFDRGIFTGKHNQDEAFLLMNSNVNAGFLGENPDVTRVAGLVN